MILALALLAAGSVVSGLLAIVAAARFRGSPRPNPSAPQPIMGSLAAEAGCGVILSRAVVEHRLGEASAGKSWRHRMRWSRSTRRSRPWGYAGQLFTMQLPLSLALLPLEDLLAFAAWIAGFFGSRVEWRGRMYEVLRDGRLRTVDPA